MKSIIVQNAKMNQKTSTETRANQSTIFQQKIPEKYRVEIQWSQLTVSCDNKTSYNKYKLSISSFLISKIFGFVHPFQI